MRPIAERSVIGIDALEIDRQRIADATIVEAIQHVGNLDHFALAQVHALIDEIMRDEARGVDDAVAADEFFDSVGDQRWLIE